MYKIFQRTISIGIALVILLSPGLSLVTAQTSDLPFAISLPFVTHNVSRTIEGQVTTADLKPVPGVDIITNDGNRTITDEQGRYSLTGLTKSEYVLMPSKDGFTFSPETATIALPPDAADVNFSTNLVACTDIILNGGFETDSGWELPITEYKASYSTAVVHQGLRSLRTGIVNVADNRYSYSSGRQIVTVPSGIASANLIFYTYPQTTEAVAKPEIPESPEGITIGESTLSGDVQYVVVTDLYGTVKKTLLWQKSNASTWQGYSFDMTQFAGQTIQLHFGTYNDGALGITSMYIDDVVFQLCPSSTTPTPTPTPVVCGNLLVNDSFETNLGWEIPITAFSAGYSTIRAHTGTRSMRTGITDLVDNRYSYSDAGQWVYIPSNALAATLNLWSYPITSEAEFTSLSAVPVGMRYADFEERLDLTDSGDVQYILILDKYQYIIDTLLWQRSNARTWTLHSFDLKKYAGRTIKIQFGTYNDGYNGFTSMFVDDATLSTCATEPPPPPTPTPTPVPSCTNIILNGGLETTGTWYLPLTAYPAAYSTEKVYAGSRSMRTGISNTSINVFSYSDARQTVTIPANAASATLKFYANTYSSELPDRPLPDLPNSANFGDEVLSEDVQYLLILQYETWIDTLLWQRRSDQTWVSYTYDLKKYAGKTISLQFGTFNNGYGGITNMFFDEVTLQVCTP